MKWPRNRRGRTVSNNETTAFDRNQFLREAERMGEIMFQIHGMPHPDDNYEPVIDLNSLDSEEKGKV